MDMKYLFKMNKEELRKPDPQLFGNTKWGDHVFMFFYISNSLSIAKAAKDLGTDHKNFKYRIERVNTIGMLQMIELFETYEPEALSPEELLRKQRPIRKKRHGDLTIEIIMGALNKTRGNIKKTAELLNCSESTIRNWLFRYGL